jgi:hypothetical protein
VFTAQQPTSQSLTQSFSQSGKQVATQTGVQSGIQTGVQSGTQVVSQNLTCTFTNGNGTKTFHRDGERTGIREGSRIGTRDSVREGDRDGTRTGTQAGTQTGSLAYDLDVEARKAKQYTGFILKGWKGQPSYKETGTPVWNAPKFGEYTFGRVTVFTTSVAFGLPPRHSAGFSPGAASQSPQVTSPNVYSGNWCDIDYGDVVPTGSAKLLVNGVPLA